MEAGHGRAIHVYKRAVKSDFAAWFTRKEIGLSGKNHESRFYRHVKI